MKVTVIGAGLAGSECAWQLAQRGVEVTLYEMKPEKRTPAHVSDYFAELCCSNSLRSDQLENAVGLLKEEMRRLGSLILSCADATRVEAGGALAVDRDGFAKLVTERILNHPNISSCFSDLIKNKCRFLSVYCFLSYFFAILSSYWTIRSKTISASDVT